MSKKPCKLAFSGLNIKHGSVGLCYKSENVLNISLDDFSNTDLLDIANSTELRKTRRDLLRGKWPEDNNCIRCKREEEMGAESPRQKHMKHYQEWHSENIDKDGYIKNIDYLEIRFRNTCNLACRHCDPRYSSQWVDVIKKNPQINIGQIYKPNKTDKSLSFAKKPKEYVDFIAEQIKSHGRMFLCELTGGEPFFQREMYEFLEELSNYPDIKQKMVLVITTNGTIAGHFRKYDLQNLLSGFGELVLKLSLDSSKSFYEYFRQNAKWEDVENGVIKVIKSIPETVFKISITPTVFQAMRFEEIYNDFRHLFYEVMNREMQEYDLIISSLHKPEYLRVKSAPLEFKERYIKQLLDFRKKNNTALANKLTDKTLKEMTYYQIFIERDWKHFCTATSSLDSYHNKNVFNYFPELKEYWI